jgi:hypothetical protein
MDAPGSARIESVPPDCAAARRQLKAARRFVGDGTKAELSPESRFALVYDGLRYALDAVITGAGTRVTSGVGHHARLIEAAAAMLGSESEALLRRADRARRARNRIQYDAQGIGEDQVKNLVSAAREILALAEARVEALCS